MQKDKWTVKTNLDAYEESILVMAEMVQFCRPDRHSWPITDEELHNHFITRNTFKEPKKLIYHWNNEQIKHKG